MSLTISIVYNNIVALLLNCRDGGTQSLAATSRLKIVPVIHDPTSCFVIGEILCCKGPSHKFTLIF